MPCRNQSPRVKVGFVGYGTSVRLFHLPFIQAVPDIEIHAFLQRSPPPTKPIETGLHCSVDYPQAKHYRTLETFLTDKEIDLVVVCTGISSHCEITLRALEAGKHVVVEKPFTATSEEAQRVIVAAKKANVILSVYQNRRYDSDFLTLKKVIAEGHLGRIHEAEFHHDLPDPPWLSRFPVERTPGSGMAFNAGSHILDQALLLFGLPTSVTAFYWTVRGIESDNEDSYTITLQYDIPLIVYVKTNAVSVMPRLMTHFIRGTQGTFINFGADPQLDDFLAHGIRPGDLGYGLTRHREDWAVLSTKTKVLEDQIQKQGVWTAGVYPVAGAWQEYYGDVVKAIRGHASLVVDPELSRNGIRVLELAAQSAAEGRTLHYSE